MVLFKPFVKCLGSQEIEVHTGLQSNKSKSDLKLHHKSYLQSKCIIY